MPQWVLGQSFDGLVGLAGGLRGCSQFSLRSRSFKGRVQSFQATAIERYPT